MSKKYGTLSSVLLTEIGEATGFFTWPLEGTNKWARQQMQGAKSRKRIYDALYRLEKEGFVKREGGNGNRIIRLTAKGRVEILMVKARVPVILKSWDGKWRVVLFDIPEGDSDKRDRLRRLLLANGFTKLQHSVYISPYPLSREAIKYLKETGLIEFIRIARIEELDDDKDLRRKYGLR